MAFGVIFDMDGVLLDSTAAHLEAFRVFGERHGFPFSEEFFTKIYGHHNRTIFPMWLGDDLDPALSERYALEKETLYREMAPRHVKPLDGVIQLVDALKSDGFELAVGSSGPRLNVEVAMEILGRRSAFTSTVSGDDVKRAKPDPDIFLKAASEIGVPPAQCVVIEDALAGLVAAQAAGMFGIAISSSLPRAQLRPAQLVIDHFSELSPAKIRELITRRKL